MSSTIRPLFPGLAHYPTAGELAPLFAGIDMRHPDDIAADRKPESGEGSTTMAEVLRLCDVIGGAGSTKVD